MHLLEKSSFKSLHNPYINSSKDEMLKRVKIDGLQLLFCSKELKDNYDVALSAVKDNGFAYRFVSKRLKDNKAIVKAAVTKWFI